MDIAVIALLGILVLGVLWLIFVVSTRARDRGALEARLDNIRAELQSSLSSNLKLVNTQLSSVSGQVTEQLSSVTMQLHSSTGQISSRMDNAARAVSEVRQTLGELSKATEQVFELGRSISGLEEILKAPKLRGGLGEFFLGDLLSQLLPSEHYEFQYPFRNGARVDAVIKLKDGIVPIDSKFPLENFRRITEAASDEARKNAKKKFISDCKKHIDSIASAYIRPEEGTLNFALMYIPAENVYYEMIIKDEDLGDEKLLSSFAFAKRVIPVSPNSFYAYLQTILIGLRGLEIGDKAGHILAHLNGLKGEFERFMSDMETLGRHVTNAKTKSDEIQRKAERFNDRLSSLGEAEPVVLEEAEIKEKI